MGGAYALSMGLNSTCYMTLSLQDNELALNPERVVETLDYKIIFHRSISYFHLLKYVDIKNEVYIKYETVNSNTLSLLS